MNNANESQNDKLEMFLKKARLSEPSSELKGRIITEVTRVWNQTSVELSWRIPFMRLAASAAAAGLMIWLANISAGYSVARWQAGEVSATRQQSFEIDVFPDMPYNPFVRHLASTSREYPSTDGSGLREYIETIHRLLDETPKNDASNPPDPVKGRSRLLLDFSDSRSYS